MSDHEATPGDRVIRNDPERLGIISGIEGWQFLGNRHQFEFDQFLGTAILPDHFFRDWVRTLGSIRRFVEARGALFLAYVAPSKPSIYADKLMPADLVGRGASAHDSLTAEARAAGECIIDLRPCLAAGRGIADTYSPRNSHWTDFGACIAWQEIAKRLQPAGLGRDFAALADTVGVDVIDYGDEMSGILDLPGLVRNPWTVPVLSRPLPQYGRHGPEGMVMHDGSDQVTPLDAPVWVTCHTPVSPQRCLFIGDSTGDGLSPYVMAAFAETHFRRHHFTEDNRPFNVAGAMESIEPDVVLFGFTERYIRFPLGDLDYWLAADAFDHADTAGELWWSDAATGSGLRLVGSPGIRQPAHVLIAPAGPRPSGFHVRIGLRSSSVALAVVSFTDNGRAVQTYFWAGPGYNEMYVSMPWPVDGSHFWIAFSDDSDSRLVQDIRLRPVAPIANRR